ncbi:uncharacterized protein LOC100367738 [Saccoglossus kowalevskii]|uniref:Uncharacterized protein LOC100367738 n=1 Tax=Saccoglossus kowalevskii TaxID=10224 RepID=A0ABM0GW58_SACKO|nr:PREDICTED: uncharacterized protein LOC100367738 [Saccoglossus kowalevskii]
MAHVVTWNLNHVQARNLFRRAKEERSGEMGTADFEQMGKAVVGCRHGDLTENVPTDEQLACVQTMSENGRGNMRPKQIRDIADKVVKPRLEALVEDGECILNGLSVEEAASMPEFMLQLPFETFQNETCTTEILEAALCSFGNLDDAEHMRNHPIHNRRELINIILNFYEIGETDPITSDVLNCLGGLACGLTPESIANIEEDALSDYISTSGQCCLRKLQRQAIVDRVMESTGATSIDDNAMVDYLDDLILFLAPDDTAAVDADTIYTKIVDENALDTVLDLSKEAKRLCRFDRKDEDGENTAEDEQRSALIEQAQDGSSTESKRRRRRETSSPCDLIARAEEYCTAFSAEEINSWTTDDFTCALDYMSTICSWSEDQLTALISQAKEVYGADVSQWSGSDLTSLGCIAQGLTHSELSTANIDSNSVVEALSQYDGWSEQQADAALTQYLTLTGKTADTLDATDLSSLMYFLAALDSSSVTQIDIDAFKDAIAVLSEITSFNHDQLDAFLDLCRQIYGDSDISNWLEEDIGEAGVFMAGTTANELSSLSEDQLAGIQALTFSIIRGEVLGALSAAQLENLGSDQVNYISDSTRDLLTAEQIEALETALYGNEVAPATDGSGATGLACSMVAMATSMMLVVFRI